MPLLLGTEAGVAPGLPAVALPGTNAFLLGQLHD
jgi:hypothetical protein